MRRVLIRYRLKPDQVERNEELVRAVYEELHRAAPSGFRYVTFKLEDGVSFMHISESEGEESPLADISAAKEFQQGIADRCEEPPVISQLTEVGLYRSGPD
jgi:hypothetical protein